MKNLTDLEIIASVKRGNQTDYAIIIDRYKNKAFSLVKRILKNEMDAEEVLQDAFLRAFNGLNSFKQESKFSTWFYRIVYNTAISRVNSKKRKIENETASIDDFFNLESHLDIRTTENINFSSFITNMLEKIPSNYSALLNLFYINGMSCEEISEIMNISVSNVKVMLHRSRNALRDYILKNDLLKELI
ncbi:MAG: sigma-70 family RNA polymerase sigma factor [Ignavibacteriaceae bacterium]|nr:sigma-70 family RNA polymerase sigma factor [Ignavibacteriaceae bacterium]